MIMVKQKKLNFKALFLGLIALLISLLAFHFTLIDRNIRLNGKVVKAPIVEFYGRLSRPNSSASVIINGEKLNAGKFDNRGYFLGDSIEVCYIPGEYCVIQKRMKPTRYYLFFSLEAIPFIAGIYLIIAGILGIEDKQTINNNKICT